MRSERRTTRTCLQSKQEGDKRSCRVGCLSLASSSSLLSFSHTFFPKTVQEPLCLVCVLHTSQLSQTCFKIGHCVSLNNNNESTIISRVKSAVGAERTGESGAGDDGTCQRYVDIISKNPDFFAKERFFEREGNESKQNQTIYFLHFRLGFAFRQKKIHARVKAYYHYCFCCVARFVFWSFVCTKIMGKKR